MYGHCVCLLCMRNNTAFSNCHKIGQFYFLDGLHTDDLKATLPSLLLTFSAIVQCCSVYHPSFALFSMVAI